jgi:hypothetical protein
MVRLAVAVDHQGLGLGATRLQDPIGRTLATKTSAGVRALAVHANNERARGFTEHFGFRPSPSDRLHLFELLLKDLQSAKTAPARDSGYAFTYVLRDPCDHGVRHGSPQAPLRLD